MLTGYVHAAACLVEVDLGDVRTLGEVGLGVLHMAVQDFCEIRVKTCGVGCSADFVDPVSKALLDTGHVTDNLVVVAVDGIIWPWDRGVHSVYLPLHAKSPAR